MRRIETIHKDLTAAISRPPEHVAVFFKNQEGGYASHDQFLGITVPDIRIIAKKYHDIDFQDIQELLESKINEFRLLALIIMTLQYTKADADKKDKIFHFYIKNKEHVNNWNLVDASAHLILGAHLLDKDHACLFEMVQSPSLWDRRIAIVATWYFIRKGHYTPTLALAPYVLNDTEDLIHKAMGWMLRELGKKSTTTLEAFLETQSHRMPRTMLRYAIEKFPYEQRQYYMRLKTNPQQDAD